MKKIIFVIATVLSINEFASKMDLHIKAGYDFYRLDTDIATLPTKNKKLVLGGYDRGFVVGLEAYPV